MAGSEKFELTSQSAIVSEVDCSSFILEHDRSKNKNEED
jgi:hypothetical protein